MHAYPEQQKKWRLQQDSRCSLLDAKEVLLDPLAALFSKIYLTGEIPPEIPEQ